MGRDAGNDGRTGSTSGAGWWLAAVPNGLTLARLALGIAFPLLPAGGRLPAFLTAAATEALDGPIARWLGATSTFGRIFDPIADKVFVLAVLGTLLADGTIAWWMVPLVAARDLMVLGGGIWVAIRQGIAGLKRMPPTLLGKLTTAAQYLLLLALLAQPSVSPRLPIMALVVVTATLSLLAGADYLRRFDREDPTVSHAAPELQHPQGDRRT